MKKSFTLLEIIIVLSIIAIITSYFVLNGKKSVDFTNETKIKADIAFIKSSLSNTISKTVLLSENELNRLDNASINKKDEKLFTNIVKDLVIYSTNEEEKRVGSWVKISSNSYKIFLTTEEELTFKYENSSFKCVSEVDICKKYE